jgi:hypothetical protein
MVWSSAGTPIFIKFNTEEKHPTRCRMCTGASQLGEINTIYLLATVKLNGDAGHSVRAPVGFIVTERGIWREITPKFIMRTRVLGYFAT